MNELLFLGTALAALALASPATATFYTVTSTADNIDSVVHGGAGTQGSPFQMSSLRGAIIAANANAGADTIVLPAGTYTLTIVNTGGANEDACLQGDLDVTDSLTITGASPTSTIIQAGTTSANGIDKVLAINPFCDHALSFAMSGVTVRFGRNTQPSGAPDFSYTGGGMDWCGNGASTLTLSNCVFDSNSNVNGYGGGLNIDEVAPATGLVTITNTVFSGNTCASTGGGLNIFGDDVRATLSGCTISNNTTLATAGAGAQGGGVNIRITGSTAGTTPSVTINNNTLIFGNTAHGFGGGVSVSGSGNQNVTIQSSTITANTVLNNGAISSQGGGLYHDNAPSKTTSLLNVVLFNNHSDSIGTGASPENPEGGGICVGSGNVSLGSGTVISGNSSVDGAGVFIRNANAALSMTGGTITNNQAKNNGGGFFVNNGTGTLSGVTVVNNLANSDSSGGGDGGGLCVKGGILSASFCRIASNAAASGNGLAQTAGAATVTNNWWGANNPASLISGTATFSPWLKLNHFASPNPIVVNNPTTLFATFLTNSAGTAIPVANLNVLVGIPIAFGNPVKGTLSNPQTVVQSSGMASATFTAGSVPGAGSADATVDGVTVTAPITINCPAITGTVGGGGTICSNSSSSVTVSVSGGTPPYTVVLNNGGGTQSGTGPAFNFTVSPATTTTYSVNSASSHDNNGCAITGSGNATVTVNPAPATPAITPSPSNPCASSAGNQASGPAGATTYAWTIANGAITSATNVQTITYTAGNSGPVALTLRVGNASGCTATNSLNVPLFLDTIPPGVTCSSNITVTATGSCPAVVAFSITATDNCAVSSVVANPPSGSAFPVGTNTVTVTATDTTGNTNTCSFKVIVVAGPAPQLSIARQQATAILSWPRAAGCYSLQFTPTILSSNLWTSYAGPLVTNGANIYVTNAPGGNRFFRLSH